MKKIAISALFAALLLAGCGGGGNVVADTAATASTGLSADVVLRQLDTTISVSPGVETLVTRIKVECKSTWGLYCDEPTGGGDIGLYSEIRYLGMTISYNGSSITSWFNEEVDDEGRLFYRLTLPSLAYYAPGYIDIEAFVSPDTPTGAKTDIKVRTISSSFDKTLKVIDGKTSIEAVVLPHLTPVEVYGGSPFEAGGNGTFGEVASFMVRCPVTARMGCTFMEFYYALSDLIPRTTVQVLVDSNIYVEYELEEDEEYYFSRYAYIGRDMYPGEELRITVNASMLDGFAEVGDISTRSGNVPVLPIIDNPGCSTILMQGTDGGESC